MFQNVKKDDTMINTQPLPLEIEVQQNPSTIDILGKIGGNVDYNEKIHIPQDADPEKMNNQIEDAKQQVRFAHYINDKDPNHIFTVMEISGKQITQEDKQKLSATDLLVTKMKKGWLILVECFSTRKEEEEIGTIKIAKAEGFSELFIENLETAIALKGWFLLINNDVRSSEDLSINIQYKVDRMMDVSTGHITRNDDIKLKYTKMDVTKRNCGWFIRINTNNEAKEKKNTRNLAINEGFSSSFIKIIDKAIKLDCKSVLLDADANGHDDLDDHIW